MRIYYRRNESANGVWEVRMEGSKKWTAIFSAFVGIREVHESLSIIYPKLKATRFRDEYPPVRAYK